MRRESLSRFGAWAVLGGLGAIVAACSGSSLAARPHAENERFFPEDGGCMSLEEARKAIADLATANDKAEREAVAEEGYSPISIQGVARMSNDSREPLWSVKDGDGPTGKSLFGPMAPNRCGESFEPDALFVTGKQGEVFAVNRDPAALTVNIYEVCGCETDLPSRQCGGVVMPDRQWVYDLPKGARFAGTVSIRAPRTMGRWEAVGQNNTPCPPPPPLP